MEIKTTPEFEQSYELKERYYLTANQEQRVERTLIWKSEQYPEEVIATEDCKSMSKSGALYQIKRLICELESPTNQCIESRYRRPVIQIEQLVDRLKVQVTLCCDCHSASQCQQTRSQNIYSAARQAILDAMQEAGQSFSVDRQL